MSAPTDPTDQHDPDRNHVTERSTLDAALALHAAGLCVIPAATDGTKAPGTGRWRDYMTTRPDEDQLRAWFAHGHPGIGIVAGAVSGGLVALDVEGRAVAEGVFTRYVELADNSGLGDVLRRVMGGYTERTASGGLHLLWRVDDGQGVENMKLARRPSTEEELAAFKAEQQASIDIEPDEQTRAKRQSKLDKTDADDRPQVLIETKSEGGFLVVAPSRGPVHPTGQPWTLQAGGPDSIVTLERETSDALLELARMLDVMPRREAPSAFSQPASTRPADGGTSPGDDYEARVDWSDILTPHGWTELFHTGQTRYWRRPGKRMGISATTGHASDRDRLYVFTTSTEFDSETPYTKFGAYALLEHGGDHKAAAKALKAAGYGQPTPEPPRHLSVVGGQFSQPGQAAAADGTAALAVDEPAPVTALDTYSRTDDGNALRLVDSHGHEVRHCPQRGWLVWDGHRWTWDDRGKIRELARGIARGLPDEAKEDASHKARTLSARGLESMVKVAQTDPRIVTPLAELDANPWQLNTPAGVVDLRTGELGDPDPTALHTRSTLVAPDFEAPADRWHQFLDDTFGGDQDLITYVQRLLGLSLVGTVLEQILPFAFGDGANGKSTLADTVMRLVGIGETGYAISAPSEMLLASSANSHPTEIARLAGARFVVASELDDGQRFAEARIKMLTGRDVITGRFMRQDFFSFTPTHTLWLLGNHQPQVRTGGPAFWRRLRLVPFLHTVPEERRDAHLEEKLVDGEGPAILAWLIRGAASYMDDGLTTPESVRVATATYAQDQDTVARFVSDMCTTGDPAVQGMTTVVAKIRTAYENWCRSEGEEPVSAKKLTGELNRKFGVSAKRDSRARYYAGIRLNVSFDDEGAE
ncbi:phage/plasmid primase, P4 family [Nocardiopsis lucentensis]|uniref:phage/plasmid primase, P4 family n=1 Tax=Nocardiopsis lucentensis TaxID=53441 RepID=UPI00034A0E56|nr:phage/plasmid primase, P4 family [Nocardiopsis lucentensis]